MDFRDIIGMALKEYYSELKRALDGLTDEERRFQPTPHSHHIDFAVWHMARVEDDWVQRFAQKADTIWRRDGWHKKFGMSARDSGLGYTVDQVANLPAFDVDEMMTYYDSAREGTLEYIESMTADDLDTIPHPERRPDYTVGKMFSHLIVEESQHTGQVAYLRGMQRGLNQ